MATPLDNVCCASLPRDALAVLADLRCQPEVRVAWAGDRAWLYWAAGDEAVLRRLLPVPGVKLYERRGELWFRPGQALPVFDLPEDLSTQSLERALTPAPFHAELPGRLEVLPIRLRLVREQSVRPAAALRCRLAELVAWAETATSRQLAGLRAARAGSEVLVVGTRLPPIPGAERFWGQRVLIPLGHRVEPALPESALYEALGVDGEAIVLFRETDVEIVAESALQPLSRAGARLALRA
jgi:hypothetical protein